MANCTKCGAELKEGAKFCKECGAPVVIDEAVEQTAEAAVAAEEAAKLAKENEKKAKEEAKAAARAEKEALKAAEKEAAAKAKAEKERLKAEAKAAEEAAKLAAKEAAEAAATAVEETKEVVEPVVEAVKQDPAVPSYTPVAAEPIPVAPMPSATKLEITEAALPRKFRPLKTGQWMWMIFLMVIPVIGWLYTLICALSNSVNRNRRNFCRAVIYWFLIGLLLLIIAAVVGYFLVWRTNGAAITAVFSQIIEQIKGLFAGAMGA